MEFTSKNNIVGKVVSNNDSFGVVSNILLDDTKSKVIKQKNVKQTEITSCIGPVTVGHILNKEETELVINIDLKKRIIEVLLNTEQGQGYGIAKCHKNDIFIQEKGIQIASRRAKIDLLQKQIKEMI